MMKTTTFHYNGSRTLTVVVNSAGTVIESNSESYPVGMKKAVKQLRACGWRTPKMVVQYDAFGRRNPNTARVV